MPVSGSSPPAKGVRAGTGRRWRAEIIVLPKEGVNDPAGVAVKGGLHSLGYEEVGEVRVGKTLHVNLIARGKGDAERRAHQMCDELLANPIIESYQVSVHELEMVSTSDKDKEVET